MQKKITIVEDEEIILDLLQKKLIQEGYDVSAARNGEEGIETLKEIKPDLVLLDIITISTILLPELWPEFGSLRGKYWAMSAILDYPPDLICIMACKNTAPS